MARPPFDLAGRAALVPGVERTVAEPLVEDRERAERIRGNIPAGRSGERGGAVGARSFRASPAADALTGRTPSADGVWRVS